MSELSAKDSSTAMRELATMARDGKHPEILALFQDIEQRMARYERSHLSKVWEENNRLHARIAELEAERDAARNEARVNADKIHYVRELQSIDALLDKHDVKPGDRMLRLIAVVMSLRKIQSQAGLPDPAEACRQILKTAGEAIAKMKGGAK